jgi:hypothetical protein
MACPVDGVFSQPNRSERYERDLRTISDLAVSGSMTDAIIRKYFIGSGRRLIGVADDD